MSSRIKLNTYFYLDEFACPCCGGVFGLDAKLVTYLLLLRTSIERPVIITDGGGTRCPAYQRAIYEKRGKEPNMSSRHLSPRARVDETRRSGGGVDIKLGKLPGESDAPLWTDERIALIREVFGMPERGGLGLTASRKWVHVDTRDVGAEWRYPGA